MFGRVLQALIDDARPTGWMLVLVLVVVIVWLFVRHVDRLAIAADCWMLAWDRRAARKAALTAKDPEEREHALAVLDQLQQQRQANGSGLPSVAGHDEEPGHHPG
jgi:small-conductance mechanosensitive channel